MGALFLQEWLDPLFQFLERHRAFQPFAIDEEGRGRIDLECFVGEVDDGADHFLRCARERFGARSSDERERETSSGLRSRRTTGAEPISMVSTAGMDIVVNRTYAQTTAGDLRDRINRACLR